MARYFQLSIGTFVVCFLYFALPHLATGVRYQPNWASLDKRPLPDWYDEAKLGIFLHWGVFSVPSYAGAWFWDWWKGPQPRPSVVEFMASNYPPSFTYADFAAQFTAEFFDPDKWADIFNASGARYVVLTTKHHEGFCLWPTKHSWNWNAMDVGPNRDLVGDLADAIRKRTSLRFGTYHSLFEFFNPLYLKDKANNFTTNDFVALKTMPELFELVNRYKPEVIWSDGEWEANSTYWNATNFLAWLYNESPVKDTVVTNDRWGNDSRCKHGGYMTCEDQYNPGLQSRKWESCLTVDKSAWEFRRNLHLNGIHSIEEIVATLVQAVSCGGNLLLNVGPTKEGTIVPVFEERLRQLGKWLSVNGEAIYATRPWLFQNDTVESSVWYTSKKNSTGAVSVYAIALKWPSTDALLLGSPEPTPQTTVTLLGYPQPIQWSKGALGGLSLHLPVIPYNKMPCQWAWVFRLNNLYNV
ncbi:hypothetical protein BaRGS_00015384 [Batillaria attramentaria]|uniref:alpha-L-fucosidase n=1 Tax=Batillaria attramentaria TaxID=370345 RepID=A0ABD0L1Q6_9CAEN